MAKRAQPIEWTIWEAVEAFNDPADLAEYERLKVEAKPEAFSSKSPKGAIQGKLNGTVTGKLRRGQLTAVGRVGDPNAPCEELTPATWTEYDFASYDDSIAAHRRDLKNRIYDVRIAPLEWGDALVRKHVRGEQDASDGSDLSRNKGGTPGNPHWEEVFDALLTPLIRPAEFESQRHLIEAIEETFQKLGYEAPTQDGIRKRLAAKWPILKALAVQKDD